MSIPQWFTNMILSIEHVSKAGQLVEFDEVSGSLGYGLLYYSLVRIFKPKNVVVIGSHRGFSPLMFARAMNDNNNGGKVIFIDPSYADDFWKDPAKVQQYFLKFGMKNIEHHCLTTQAFIHSKRYRELVKERIQCLMVDGLHTAEQAEFDHKVFEPCLQGVALFHDTMLDDVSTMYKEPYRRSVGKYIDQMEKSGNYHVFTIPINPGLTITIRKDRTNVIMGNNDTL